MSIAWDMVSLDVWDEVILRMPMYWLTVSNQRCWAEGNDGIVILLNKADGRLRIGERTFCLADRVKNIEIS